MTTAAAVRERPILFSSEMVRAILDGRKSQTRRVVNPDGGAARFLATDETTARKEMTRLSPYGVVGGRLWVRETFTTYDGGPRDDGEDQRVVVYRADPMFKDCGPGDIAWNWSPSIFMPRCASRITLEITNVRVERLQEISSADCYAEGVRTIPSDQRAAFVPGTDLDFRYRSVYSQLWDSINAKRGYGWDVNPWVWVIEFARVTA